MRFISSLCGDHSSHPDVAKCPITYDVHRAVMAAAQRLDYQPLTIHVKVKSVYGNDLIYVQEERAKDYIRTLTGKVTVNEYDIEALRGLGIEVVYTGAEQPPTEPQPLDAEDEWVVFGHVANARLGYFADWRDAHTLYAAEHAECLSEPGHEVALCHVRIAHRSAPDFLATKTGE